MAKFIAPTEDEIVSELRPWVRGFISKEYNFLEFHDQEDLVQEGCLNLLLSVRKLAVRSPTFPCREEYMLYVKAMVRNAVRDCVLKLRCRFNISLFKLRRQLREQDTTLSEYMTDIGDNYRYVTDVFDSMDDQFERHGREDLLTVLSPARKGCKGMSVEECRELLRNVIDKISPETQQLIVDKWSK